MRVRNFILGVLALTLLGSTNAFAQAQKSVVGVWERISHTDREGKVTQPPADPSIFVIYSANGYVSQTVVPAGRKKIDKPAKDLTKEELLERYERVVARYGTYKLSGDKLIRKDLSHSNPNNEGQETERTVRFEEDMIILVEAGTKHEAKFRRVK